MSNRLDVWSADYGRSGDLYKNKTRDKILVPDSHTSGRRARLVTDRPLKKSSQPSKEIINKATKANESSAKTATLKNSKNSVSKKKAVTDLRKPSNNNLSDSRQAMVRHALSKMTPDQKIAFMEKAAALKKARLTKEKAKSGLANPKVTSSKKSGTQSKVAIPPASIRSSVVTSKVDSKNMFPHSSKTTSQSNSQKDNVASQLKNLKTLVNASKTNSVVVKDSSSLDSPAAKQVSTKAASKQSFKSKIKEVKKSINKSVNKLSNSVTKIKANDKSTNIASQPVSTPSLFMPLPASSPAPAKPVANASVAKVLSNNSKPTVKSKPNVAGNVRLDNSGLATMTLSTPLNNFINRLASVKITFRFKINKKKILRFLRYFAIVAILAASAYLAWDTYSTNQAVKNNFNNPVSAMSIAGTNPATADQTAISNEAKQAYTAPSDQPRYISIPAINVNARVKSVGVNSKGNIDTPNNLNDTAWYDGSAKPGQDGQVFIDGHTSFSNSINAAFNDLPKLKTGDVVTIETGAGKKINYVISVVKTVDADKVDMGEALNPPEGASKGLTLMTCTGTFNYRTQTADKRLVVYAVQQT